MRPIKANPLSQDTLNYPCSLAPAIKITGY